MIPTTPRNIAIVGGLLLVTLFAVAEINSPDPTKRKKPTDHELFMTRMEREDNKYANFKAESDLERPVREGCHAASKLESSIISQAILQLESLRIEAAMKAETHPGRAELLAIKYKENKDTLQSSNESLQADYQSLSSSIINVNHRERREELIKLQAIQSDLLSRSSGIAGAARAKFYDVPDSDRIWSKVTDRKDYEGGNWLRDLDGLRPDLSEP